jgi:hypothetical protein
MTSVGFVTSNTNGTSGFVSSVVGAATVLTRFAKDPVSWVADIILVLIAGLGFTRVAFKLLVNFTGFCVSIIFMPLALALWVLPATKGALRTYMAILTEHGVFFIALSVVGVIVPAFAAGTIQASGYPNITSAADFLNALDSNGYLIEPEQSLFWILLFYSGAMVQLYTVPENIARRLSAMVQGGGA